MMLELEIVSVLVVLSAISYALGVMAGKRKQEKVDRALYRPYLNHSNRLRQFEGMDEVCAHRVKLSEHCPQCETGAPGPLA